jgi:hypothetical protein
VRLLRIDTETNDSVPIGLVEAVGFVATAGAVWESGPDVIVRRDPLTGEEIARVPVNGLSGALEAGGGAVWAAIYDGTVARYDIAADRVTTIDVGGTPHDLVFAGGSLWVAVEDDPPDGVHGRPPEPWEILSAEGGRAVTVDDVSFVFSVPTAGWERFGRISVNKSAAGPQDAEAIVYWTSFPGGDNADRCGRVLNPRGGGRTGLAAAVAAAPGTELVTGPTDVTVGGRPAKHVVLTVREDAGCDPGFFYSWTAPEGGAGWAGAKPGDTIRVWIVDVDGTRLFVAAVTRPRAGSELEQEVVQIVESIRFPDSLSG